MRLIQQPAVLEHDTSSSESSTISEEPFLVIDLTEQVRALIILLKV